MTSFYEARLEHYQNLPREEVERLFAERAIELSRIRLETQKSRLPDGVGHIVSQTIEGVHHISDCLDEVLRNLRK